MKTDSRKGRSGENVPPIFAPFALRDLTLNNRIVVSPMCMYTAVDGTVGDFHLVHLGSRAMGGAGLVISEMTDVCAEGRISPGCAGLWNEDHAAAWKRIVDFVHAHTDSKIGVQLAHAGRKGSVPRAWERATGSLGAEGWEVVAPSPIPLSAKSPMPRAMGAADIAAVTRLFVRSAALADAAGFDMIELHMAHGYLLSSFMSPLSNKRTDAYGGGLDGRMRFPLEVFRAVRAAFPAAKPISCRISAIDWEEGGNTIADGIEISRLLYEAGCDIIDVSTGAVTDQRRPSVSGLFQTPYSEAIRRALGRPTMTVGNIKTAGEMNDILAQGKADLCLMAKGHLYDPYFARHAAREAGFDMPWPNQYKRVFD